MPWRKVLPMDQRRQFVQDARRYGGSFAELCRRYGVSR
jgi:transposase-like protein